CQRPPLVDRMDQAGERDQRGDEEDAAQTAPVAAREVPLQGLALGQEDEVVEGQDLHRRVGPLRLATALKVSFTAAAEQSSVPRPAGPAGPPSAGARRRP